MKLWCWICGLALIFGPCVGASEPETHPRLISLEECLRLALEKNFDINIERYNEQIARFGLAAARGVYEPSLDFGVRRDYVDQPATFDPKKSGIDLPYELTHDAAKVGISGLLPTGLRYDLAATGNYLDAKTDFGLLPSTAALYPPDGIRRTNQYYSTAGITLTQPLLKNFWTDTRRQTIAVSRQNLKMSEMALRWKIMNTVAEVEQAYYELILARANLRTAEQSLGLANSLVDSIRQAISAGAMAVLDEKQAGAQVSAAQAALYRAQQTWESRQAELKSRVSNAYGDLQAVELVPADTFHSGPELLDRQESWGNAMDKRPDLIQARAELERQKILVRYRRNQLFPNLDLVGGYGVQGWNESFGGTLGDVRDQSHPNYSYGIVLSIPLGGNQSARNNLKASKAGREQSLLAMEKLAQNILVQVDVALSKTQSAYKQATATKQARVLAEAALESAVKKLEFAEITAMTLIELQERLTSFRTAETRALADYNEAIVQLRLSEGTLLERHQLEMEVR